jgi:hypothetical protein
MGRDYSAGGLIPGGPVPVERPAGFVFTRAQVEAAGLRGLARIEAELAEARAELARLDASPIARARLAAAHWLGDAGAAVHRWADRAADVVAP